MSRLWEKGKPLDARVLQFTAAEDHQLDERLVPYDIRASIAHANMLHAANLLDDADHAQIVSGLQATGNDFADGTLSISLADEDCHTAIEKALTERIGSAGGRVHLGRSRNDQVLTALRLYMLDVVETHSEAIDDVTKALTALAERQGEIELPGYTHMQQAMPSSVRLWADGFVSELTDDLSALERVRHRISRNPLGSAAGYGTPGIAIDREATTTALGFAEVQTPVTAVQLSRGKAESQLVFELTQTLTDCSRLAADLLLYYTQEFAYIRLPVELTTGSSIMPQKRNPDVLELLRAAPATALGALNECLVLTQKLTSGYHRDLQRLKAPMFRSIDLADDCLKILVAMIDGLEFRPENITLDPGLFAAERANRLVIEEGIAFRDAYKRIAAELADG